MEQTTALRKISSLKKKIWVIRGGQGSGKSISILILLCNHASSKPNKEILIVSEELTKMRLTIIKDFKKVMQSLGLFEGHRFIAETLYRFPNGSFIKFIGLDKDDIGKGLRSDVAFFNEVNKVNVESYRQIASRTKRVIMDYNPDREFWVDTEIRTRPDCDFLQLTFEDNEMLPKEEREEILNYKRQGYNEDGSIKNSYWANIWRVYGLGEIGALEGVVFSNWTEIETLPKEARLVGYGLDFGYSNDPTALVAAYVYNGQRIYDQVIYQKGLLNSDISNIMKQHGITRGHTIYADSAEPKSIEELNRYGFNVKPVQKGSDSIRFGIGIMQQNEFQVTSRSTDFIKELNSYCWSDKKQNTPVDAMNHMVDAARYLEMMLALKPSYRPIRMKF